MHYLPRNKIVQDHHIQPEASSGESWTHHRTCLFGNQEPSRQLSHRFHWVVQLNPIQGQETSLNISLAIGEVDPKLNRVYCFCGKAVFCVRKAWNGYVWSCWSAERVKYGSALILLMIMFVLLSPRKNPKYILIFRSGYFSLRFSLLFSEYEMTFHWFRSYLYSIFQG